MRVNEKGAKREREISLGSRSVSDETKLLPLFPLSPLLARASVRCPRGGIREERRAKFSAGSYPLPLVERFCAASRITR